MPRGRDANSPFHIPRDGWKDILWRVYGEIGDDRVFLIAAGVTFYLLMALVPGLSAIFSVYGLFADRATVMGHAAALSSLVPGGGMEIINDQMRRLASQQNATLGIAFALSLVLALWSANAGVKALFRAMNVAYGEDEKRAWLELNGVSLLFTFALVCMAVVLIAATVLLPLVLTTFALKSEILTAAGTYGLVLVTGFLVVISLYRWGPSRRNARWKWLVPGAALSVIVMALASVGFGWYVANFKSYNATYGSLGAIIGFMTWIWLSVTIFLVGAEFNSEIEHQTMCDSTTGAPKPMGERGAVMADTLGRALVDDRPRHRSENDGAGGYGRMGARDAHLLKVALAVPVVLAIAALLSPRSK